MYNKNQKIKNKGETIVEVLVAVVVSTMVLTATFLMLNQSISTNVNVRNRVIALNIAREGIEAVRNIRDTNWLKYSGDRRGKWLCQDIPGSDECSGTTIHKLTTKNYNVDYNENAQRYYLTDPLNSADLNLSDTSNPYSEDRLFLDNTGRYTHTSTASTTPTSFYRQIRLVVHEGDNTLPDGANSVCTTSPQCQEHKLEIISDVQWKEEGIARRVTLEHHLYDFYERESY